MRRRKFIEQASCAAVGSATLFSTLGNLMMTNTLAQRSTNADYKALICILLAGGNDSFNMVVPRKFYNNSTNPPPGSYDEYALARANMAIPRNQLHALSYTATNGNTYGLHPSMPRLTSLFNSGNAAFLSNVGTLIHPIPDRSFMDSANLPLGLYSHADQIQQWQTSVPNSRQSIGWGGRVADVIHSINGNSDISMNISLDGRNVFQTGLESFEYSISNEGNAVAPIQKIPFGNNRGILSLMRDQAIDSMVSDMYSNIIKQTFADQMSSALDVQYQFRTAIAGAPVINTTFDTHKFARDLEMMVRSISVADQLNFSRQVYFTSFGGWDLHNDLIDGHAGKLAVLDKGLDDLYSALQDLGMEDQVTIFTISDFGRTMTSNGNGTDHAWGGNQIVLGGAVNGQEIYGAYPPLSTTANTLNVSRRGILIPQLSTDEMFAELALWFGIAYSDLPLIFPNLGNFYDMTPGSQPVGFMNLT